MTAKPTKKVIHLAIHKKTGAKVPVIVLKMDDNNVIEDYRECHENRKGFTLQMLQDRWDKCRDEVLELLKEYEVPAHVDHRIVRELENNNPDNKMPVDVAVFWEEYIYGIEDKTQMQHNKLKSREFNFSTKMDS